MTHRKKIFRGNRTSKIVKMNHDKAIAMAICPILLFILILSASSMHGVAWHVNCVRSKDALKQISANYARRSRPQSSSLLRMVWANRGKSKANQRQIKGKSEFRANYDQITGS